MGLIESFIILAITTVITEYTKPKPKIEVAKPKNLGDFSFPTATEGRVVPIIWGTVRVDGLNVTWYGDLSVDNIYGRVDRSGWDTSQVILGHKYRVGVMRTLCMGVVDEWSGFWVGDTKVSSAIVLHDTTLGINKPELFGGDKFGQGGYIAVLRFFAGQNNQAVSSYLSGIKIVTNDSIVDGGTGYAVGDEITDNSGTAGTTVAAKFKIKGVGGGGDVTSAYIIVNGEYSIALPINPVATSTDGSGTGCTLNLIELERISDQSILGQPAPAYHDICYVTNDREAGDIGTSTTPKPEKFELRRTTEPAAGLGLNVGADNINGGANPVAVIYEILTNTEWGYAEPTADVNNTNFSAAADVLKIEGNGFSFIWSTAEDLKVMVRRVESQIDGILYKNPLTQLWEIKLIRDDYDILTIPDIRTAEVGGNAPNIIDIPTFAQATWEGTSNTVRVPFTHAVDDYKDAFGYAQDQAGVLILGKNVTTEIAHPGINNLTQANAIATRELKSLSVPLASGVFILDRSLFGILPGDVVALTDADLKATRVPFRITSVDYGQILSGRIRIEAVQDVFAAATGVFGDPPSTDWVDPGTLVAAFPADQQFAIEQPYALARRDRFLDEAFIDRVMVGGRRPGGEVGFDVRQRNDTSAPTGAFALTEIGDKFVVMGALDVALNAGSPYPLATVKITALGSQQEVLDVFITETNDDALGIQLAGLCVIEPGTASEEFILVRSASASGTDINLNGVFRGVLDTAQNDHVAGAFVFMIMGGSVLPIEFSFPATNFVGIKLLPRTPTTTLAEGDATEISLQMASRTRRPIPPSSFELNGTVFSTPPTNVDLDGSGSGEAAGINVANILRRDHRTSNEINAVTLDATIIAADFPSAFSYETEVEIRDGVTVLEATTGITGQAIVMRQLDILEGLDTTTLPASLTVALRGSHTFDGVVFTSRGYMVQAFTIASELVGKTAFGALNDSEESAGFTVVADTVDHVFTLSTTLGFDVEYRLNGTGGFIQLIIAGMTSGTILAAALTNTDVITIRHLDTGTGFQKLLTMTVSSVEQAYAVMIP